MRTCTKSTVPSRLGATLVATALLAAFAGEASALIPAEIKCRDYASRIARGAMHKALQVRVNCVRRTAFGTFDPTIDCMADPEELGGPGTGDLYADRRLADLAFSGDRSGDVLARRCGNPDNPSLDVLPSEVLLDDTCSPASDDWGDVGQCLVDRGMEAALVFMEALNLPGPGPLNPAAEACMDAVHSQARRTVGGMARYRSLCFRDDDLQANGGGILECGATVMPPGTVQSTDVAKYDKRMGEFFPKLDSELKTWCDIPLEDVGYQFITPDVTGGRFELRITLDDVSARLNDLLQETVNLITFGDTGSEGTFDAAQADGFCGDGTQDGDEDCDDGNNLSCDGCDRDCTLPACGNGAVCDNEECDDGNNSSFDGCSATCISEICGNGATNPGYDEDCDAGGINTALCDTDCSFAICGDQFVNGAAGETCDEGTGLPANIAQNTPTCDSNCTAPACPDGHWNPMNTNAPAPAGGEECDTGGNSIPCDADCTLASCGDAYTNPARGETCDDGNFADNDTCPSSSTVPGSFCVTAFCGDGFNCDVGACAAETCDDGNGTFGSAESATCDDDCTPVVCGDSNINPSAGEQCDNGGLNSNARLCTTGCQNARCGDGLLCNTGCNTGPSGGNEQCDDADGDNFDMCRNNCAIATCGDSVLCSDPSCTTGPGATPEQCDSGGVNTALCDANCTAAGCGDGTFNAAAGEQCDGGGQTATCDSNCTTAICGDAQVNPLNVTAPSTGAGEQCDDGDGSSNDYCRTNCLLATCGDGITCSAGDCTSGPSGGVEACDGAGQTFGCDVDCSTAVCGDFQVNATRGEACDEGAVNTATCDSNCTTVTCGDSFTNGAAGETCDTGGDSAGCDGDCTAVVCGDSYVNGAAGETCDDGGLNGTSGFCNLSCNGITP